MSDVPSESGTTRLAPRQLRSIYQVHYSLKPRAIEMARPMPLPNEIHAYSRQVAGHMSTDNTKYLGVLQCNNGTILKPIIKETHTREIDFYRRVNDTHSADLIELRKFTARWFGCRHFTYNGHEMQYIVLEDLAQRMIEPCIMDVKIGKRTYDPLASAEKIANETSKYAACKQEYAFCIPGYQVYRLPHGKLAKYSKEHGKRLHGHAVIAALKNFLNGAGAPLCRTLVLSFLTSLWKIQRWATRQRAVRLYSASLLLVYDANRLRQCCHSEHSPVSSACRRPASVRRRSITSLHSPISNSTFSGQLSSEGPIFKKVNSVPTTSMHLQHTFHDKRQLSNSPWSEIIDQFSHNHSFQHNYENKLSQIKTNYKLLLDQLSEDTPIPNPWGSVKVIDFAHAFFNDDDKMEVDDNFREGIDNFVAIFEAFLRETDDQAI